MVVSLPHLCPAVAQSLAQELICSPVCLVITGGEEVISLGRDQFGLAAEAEHQSLRLMQQF